MHAFIRDPRYMYEANRKMLIHEANVCPDSTCTCDQEDLKI